jgi:anti-sigma B factor antagonist
MEPAEFRSEAVDESTYLIAVTGELDILNASELEAEIAQARRDGAEALVFDLSETTHLDSTGLGILHRARKHGEKGTRLALVVTPGPLQRLFDVRGIGALFNVCGTRDEAIAAVRA